MKSSREMQWKMGKLGKWLPDSESDKPHSPALLVLLVPISVCRSSAAMAVGALPRLRPTISN